MKNSETAEIIDEFKDSLKEKLETAVMAIFDDFIGRYPIFSELILSIMVDNLEKIQLNLEGKDRFANFDQSDFDLLN